MQLNDTVICDESYKLQGLFKKQFHNGIGALKTFIHLVSNPTFSKSKNPKETINQVKNWVYPKANSKKFHNKDINKPQYIQISTKAKLILYEKLEGNALQKLRFKFDFKTSMAKN